MPASQVSAGTRSEAVQEVFHEALAADLAGDGRRRDALLKQALELDPDFELARWYSGQVNYGGQWKPVDDVSHLVSTDPRWAEYDQLRNQIPNTPQAHEQLATWCEQNQLAYEAKWHWLNVLASDPANRKALGKLGMRLYEGRYLSDEQIDAAEESQGQAEEDFKKYTKQFAKWIKGAHGQSRARLELANRVAGVSEEAAIPALIDTFFINAKKEHRIRANLNPEEGDQYLRQLRRAVIQALSKMPEHEATLTLVAIALYSAGDDLTNLAAEALRSRRKTDYMPDLMQALASPIEAAISVRRSPGGQYVVHEDLAEKHPLGESHHARMNKFLTQHFVTFNVMGGPGGGGRINKIWTEEQRDYRNAMTQAANTEALVDAENAMREANNARVLNILRIVTGEDLGNEPSAWWNAWNHYNELNTPEQLPIADTYEINDYSRYSYDTYTQSYATPIRVRPVQTFSCFVAGTPVWTQKGPVAIETVHVGDLMLSQDPFTGELDYRPVLETSIGKPSPILDLSIEGETVSTTRGHRFWIPDQGWEMAKFLDLGDRLVTLGGIAELHAINKAKPQQAYNLVVGQFHTYFVGHQKLLVHDKNCPLPNLASMPGVKGKVAERTANSTTLAQ